MNRLSSPLVKEPVLSLSKEGLGGICFFPAAGSLKFPLSQKGKLISAQLAALVSSLLFLFLQCPALAAAPVVLVVGDSLSAAYGLQEKDGWVNLLRERLAKQSPHYDVVNASISGDTTRGGLTRIDAALIEHKPSVVIIELGGNDGLRGLSLDATHNNLDAMIAKATAARAKLLIVGVELPPNYGATYTRQFAESFESVAKKYKVPLVPSLLAGFGEQRELFQTDGIHPIASAQPMMMETVWKELKPLVRAR